MPASRSAISSSSCVLIGDNRRDTEPWVLLRCDARLVHRGCFNQVAHRLRARQVDAAVEIGAQREFAWFGEARSRTYGAVEAVAQNHRRSVAGYLDDGCLRLTGIFGAAKYVTIVSST